ncbi:MAG: TRAP transporter large permease [Hyphomicrobiales bacterium]|nr:TRAP transporter large permease [Hyphomicrobiales bacterium]MCP5370811.1 TRAP transporter large permease [Hyphomicrobiales bacterium]
MIVNLTLALLAFLMLAAPVGLTLFLLAFGVDTFYSAFPLIRGLGQLLWSSSDSSLLIAIPFFVLLGELLVRSGVAERTYRALDAWLSWLPGGLIHANIATATFFSATSGSSVATAATVATVATPQAQRLGYDPRLFTGAIAAGGTLGIMIPPSINLIVYGFLTQTSIPQLFLAGLVPGVLMALMFMALTGVLCTIRPALGGPSNRATWGARLRGLADLVPIVFLFLTIIGSIYLGWATPTEAAAVGVAIAAVIAAAHRGLTRDNVAAALLGTVKVTGMIAFILVAASYLNFTLGAAGLGRDLQALLDGLALGPLQTMLAVIALYIVLGFFIETLSLMVATIPIVAPVVTGIGYDPIWFGVMLILLVEMALITPPVGLNLFVVQGARRAIGAPGGLVQVMVGAAPYALVMLAMAGLLLAFPQLALWLPSLG